MPYSLTWLPDVLRSAGLKVAEVDGWRDRGRGDMGRVLGVLCHHTANPSRLNMPTLEILKAGRTGDDALPGPLAQLGLGRDGTYYVIAAGRCNHAGKGSWRGIVNGNSNFIGIEAENAGGMSDYPWPLVQMDAYQRGVAAILNHVGQGAEFCAGHKEYAPQRKTDPLFNMDTFRSTVAAIMAGAVAAPPLIPAIDAQQRPTLRRATAKTEPTEWVKTLQRRLSLTPVDGLFGPDCEAAVRRFQRDHELVPDGIVGPKTWAVLDVAFA